MTVQLCEYAKKKQPNIKLCTFNGLDCMACELYLNKAVIYLKIIKEPQIEIGN